VRTRYSMRAFAWHSDETGAARLWSFRHVAEGAIRALPGAVDARFLAGHGVFDSLGTPRALRTQSPTCSGQTAVGAMSSEAASRSLGGLTVFAEAFSRRCRHVGVSS
jgi:hypothetical protein